MKKPEEHDLKTLAGRLKWAREQRKLSQQAVAKAAKVSQGTIGNLESGERKSPRSLLNIARALAINAEWLESGKGNWADAKGYVLKAPTEDEWELLNHWRHLLSKDRKAKLAEIAALAEERQAEKDELFEAAGVTAIMEKAAHASRHRTAVSAVAVGEKLRQRELGFDEAARKK